MVDAVGIEREHSVDWTKRSEVPTLSDSRKKTCNSYHSRIQSSVSKQPAAEREGQKQAQMGAVKTAKRGGRCYSRQGLRGHSTQRASLQHEVGLCR